MINCFLCGNKFTKSMDSFYCKNESHNYVECWNNFYDIAITENNDNFIYIFFSSKLIQYCTYSPSGGNGPDYYFPWNNFSIDKIQKLINRINMWKIFK